MAKSEFEALATALYTKLTSGSDVWGARVYDQYVPAKANYPYIFMHKVGGGDTNTNLTSDPRIIYGIRCVSKSQTEAYDVQKRIQELIDDQGDYDTTTPLNAGDDWQIRTSQKTLAIVFVEDVDHATRVFHAGHQYIFMMQSAE